MTDGPSIDGDLLDALETRLRDAVGRDNAVTSDELAATITNEDTDANPKTREAIKVLMRERGLPVIGGSQGYYIPASDAAVENALETLDGRIAGIQERKHLLADNWAAWTPPDAPDGNDDGGGVTARLEIRAGDGDRAAELFTRDDDVTVVERRGRDLVVETTTEAVSRLDALAMVQGIDEDPNLGGGEVPPHVREQIEADPVLTVADYKARHGGGQA